MKKLLEKAKIKLSISKNYNLNKKNDITIKNMPSSAQAKNFPEHLHVRHYDDGKFMIAFLLVEEELHRVVAYA